MADNATLALPKDLIEPIIQAHIQAALAEALVADFLAFFASHDTEMGYPKH